MTDNRDSHDKGRDSRRQILDALRAAPQPFPQAAPPDDYRPVVPREATDGYGASGAALVDRFVQEAEKLACQVHRAGDEAQALETLLSLLHGETAISCWDPGEIPLPGLAQALKEAGIQRAEPAAENVRIGLTGAQTALAATGTLVLSSGPGRHRATSLLPPLHVAILRQDQIVPDLESWLATQRHDDFAAMRQAANLILISGPSRTADIAMELVMGMHGPRDLHVILLP